MMKSPSRWFGQPVDEMAWANADGAASTRNAADNARIIIDILRLRAGSIGRRTTPVLQHPAAVKLRCFAVAGQAQGCAETRVCKDLGLQRLGAPVPFARAGAAHGPER